MDGPIALTALALFGSMFLPLPAPAALAIVLWALASGVPFPIVLALYVTQDVLSYLAIQRLFPALSRDGGPSETARRIGLPAWLRRCTVQFRGAALSRAGLLSAALVSFYAGASVAAVRGGAPLRTAAIVIGADVLKWANGLALALGVAHAIPASPWSPIVASLARLALLPLLSLARRSRAPVLALVPVRRS